MKSASAQTRPGRKVCKVCGKDCDNRPRTKDRRGNYYCSECYDRAVSQHRAAAQIEAGAAPATSVDDGEFASLADLADQEAAASPIGQAAGACESCAAPLPPDAVLCTQCGFNRTTRTHLSTRQSGLMGAPSSLGGYFAALPGAVLFVVRPRNLWTFFVAWFVLSVGAVGGGLMLASGSLRMFFVSIFVFTLAEGAFAAFCFEVVQLSGEGENDLPKFPLSDGLDEWWSSLVVPFFAYAGTCLLVLLPTIAFAVACAFVDSLAPLPLTTLYWALGILAGMGLFCWPMLLLSVARGAGVPVMLAGRLITSVFATFPAYFCTVCLVYGSAATGVFAISKLSQSATSGVAIIIAAIGVRAYVQTAAMRAIGTYYHHCQDKLPW